MSGSEGWRIGNVKNYTGDAARFLEIHYAPDRKWDAEEPKEISIEWEIIYGKQSLLDSFPAKLLRKNKYAKGNQFADRDDFNEINGKFLFDNSAPAPRTGYIRLPFSENDYDYRELFGIRLKNPSPGTIIDPGYDEFSGASQLRYTPADSNSNLKIQIVPINGKSPIKEGEKIKFRVKSNATEEYFRGKTIPSKFQFSGMTGRPDGFDGLYAGKKDLTPTPRIFFHQGKHHHSERIQIPIKNGSTFALPKYRVAKDDMKEGLESLEIRFYWSLGGPSLGQSQTLNLKIKDKFRSSSKSNDELKAGFQLSKPKQPKINFAEKITNFNSSSDKLKINTDSFDIDNLASFAIAKNGRALKKLAKKDIDFLYCRKSGYLYFNENGSRKGFGDGGIFAIIKGAPKLTKRNLKFIGETIYAPKKFNRKTADKITNFNPSTGTLEIDTASFGVESPASFTAGKNIKEVRKLAKQDFDFLYDQKKGSLFFNENGAGKGWGDGGIIAILKGAPDLTSENIDFL